MLLLLEIISLENSLLLCDQGGCTLCLLASFASCLASSILSQALRMPALLDLALLRLPAPLQTPYFSALSCRLGMLAPLNHQLGKCLGSATGCTRAVVGHALLRFASHQSYGCTSGLAAHRVSLLAAHHDLSLPAALPEAAVCGRLEAHASSKLKLVGCREPQVAASQQSVKGRPYYKYPPLLERNTDKGGNNQTHMRGYTRAGSNSSRFSVRLPGRVRPSHLADAARKAVMQC